MSNKRIFTSKKIIVLSVFALFFTCWFNTLHAAAVIKNDQNAVPDTIRSDIKGEKEEDISVFILEHIGDAHEWHFWGKGEHKVSVPLPVILYTKNGFVTFLSSKHDRDEEGKEIFTEKGQQFINYKGKYYYPLASKTEEGAYTRIDENQVPVNEKPLDLSITKNVVALFVSVALLLILFGSIAKSYRNRAGKAPKGLQSALEPIIVFVRDDIARPQLGVKYMTYMPYLLTLFFFIWINNLLGLIPFFPGGANLTGNITVTFMLALCTFLISLVKSNKHYWRHIFNTPGVPWWLKLPLPLMPIVEFIGVLARPMALMIRLFANITAGHILVLSLLALIVILKSVFIAGFSIPFVIFISLIELLVGFLQAFIFTILSALFIGLAIEEHH